MKVLAYTSPARGHLYPTVPILLELRRRGHDVVVLTLGDEVPAIRALGIDARPIDPAIELLRQDDYLAGNALAAIRRTIAVGTARARLEIPDLRAAIAAHAPDVLLIDTNTWGAAIAAEASGLPWAVLQHFLTPLPSPDAPPFGPGLRPIGGAVGRLRNRALGAAVIGGFERSLLPPIAAIREAEGLSPVRSAREFYSRAPLTLYLTSRAFEYPRSDWPGSFRFVGPIVWEPPAVIPDWVERLERPVALVTTSSEFQDDDAIVTAALRGLADEDLDVVATVPAGRADLGPVPSNARVEPWIPHSALLPRAAVAVTHGGMGATQKALAAGVPAVVVPYGRDQLEVGRRVEASGVGVLLPRRRLTPEALRDAVRRARSLAPVARRFATDLVAGGGASAAAQAVEDLTRSVP